MNKLLINAPSGKQELIEAVAYFDPARVLWNEAVDGTLPAITLGGMTRVGTNLVLDSALLAAYQAARDAEQRTASINQVKELRRATLDSLVKNSPGIAYVYSHNYFAATEFQAGRTTSIMIDGSTVTAYLTLLGGRLSMTAAQFAAYIINENRGTVGLAIKAKEIEDEYVRLVYAAMPTMTAAQAAQAVVDYTAFCNARKL